MSSSPARTSPVPSEALSQIASYKRQLDEMRAQLAQKNIPTKKEVTWRTLGRVLKRISTLDTPVHDLLVEYDRRDTEGDDKDDEDDEDAEDVDESALTNEQRAERQEAKELKREQALTEVFNLRLGLFQISERQLTRSIALSSARFAARLVLLLIKEYRLPNHDSWMQVLVKDVMTTGGDRAPNPPLRVSSKIGRGFVNNATGRLLCPIGLDWEDEFIRSRIRNDEIDEIYDSYFVRFLYDDEKGARGAEQGLLKGPLLVQIYKRIFLSRSAISDTLNEDDDIEPPPKRIKKVTKKRSTRKNVAEMIGMTEVTPRAIAYCAVMVRFALSDAATWGTDEGFNYNRFYHCIVDYLEDNAPGSLGDKNVKKLLKWWNKQIYPKEDRATSRRPFRNFKNTIEAERARAV
ncbi:hypothetical protein VKT23_006711 [Stygiomarasmius scandens]|uniref:Uncharacterized protein n=1 Tax=Marasmiellus scandens TaxID=2682957 RepID=A0ABR1JKL7_9AGAR